MPNLTRLTAWERKLYGITQEAINAIKLARSMTPDASDIEFDLERAIEAAEHARDSIMDSACDTDALTDLKNSEIDAMNDARRI
jgi:hypothetical protein